MRDDIFNECLECWQNSEEGVPFWGKLAEKYGYAKKDSLRNAFGRERKRRRIFEKDPQKAQERLVNSKNVDGTYSSDRLVEIFEDELNDDIALLKAHNFDPDKWILIASTSNMWHALRTLDRGRVVQFQSKIRVKPITLQEMSFESISEFYSKNDFVTKIKFPKFKQSLKRVLEICSADWHLAARLFNENFSDLEEMFPFMMADVLYRIKRDEIGFSKIIFNLMGDIFHYENRQQQTERHQQVVEGNGMNPLEMFDLALSMCISAVDELLQYAPVEMMYIPGNHDGNSLYHLLACLKAYYRDVSTFSVDLGHESRKWKLIGKNLIGWQHGEMSKKNKVHWLQNDARKEWGLSEYAESHNGHWHHEEVTEHGGIKSRGLPAIASTDFWHHRSGYIGAIRATMSFIWDEDRIGWTDMWQSTGR